MRLVLAITCLLLSFACLGQTSEYAQQPVWKTNQLSVDSVITGIRKKGYCTLPGGDITRKKKKMRIDTKLFRFLDRFCKGEFDESSINRTLKKSYRSAFWRFDEILKKDSVVRYQGRLRSYGNLEPFIGYVVLDGKLIGRRVYFRIRSRMDCVQKHEAFFADLLYLLEFIPGRVNFRLDLSDWNGYIHSDIWKDPGLTPKLSSVVDSLLSKSTAR
jgi:hypothetical protein